MEITKRLPLKYLIYAVLFDAAIMIVVINTYYLYYLKHPPWNVWVGVFAFIIMVAATMSFTRYMIRLAKNDAQRSSEG